MKALFKTWTLPTALEKAHQELRWAELDVLRAQALKEEILANCAMTEARVLRLRGIVSKADIMEAPI